MYVYDISRLGVKKRRKVEVWSAAILSCFNERPLRHNMAAVCLRESLDIYPWAIKQDPWNLCNGLTAFTFFFRVFTRKRKRFLLVW